jgi:hypothetical protein
MGFTLLKKKALVLAGAERYVLLCNIMYKTKLNSVA